MKTNVKLEYGSATFEIQALEDDNYKDEVLEMLEFIGEHEDQFEILGEMKSAPKMADSGAEDKSLDEFLPSQTKNEEEENAESDPLYPIASRIKVPVSELNTFLHVEPEEDSPPFVYTEDLDIDARRQVDKQRIVSLIILYLWDECYGYDRMKSTQLKDSLEFSDTSSSGMANMYQGKGDRYFDRRGRGPSATVGLTPPGKRQARKELTQIVNQR
ncbi:hypothetical protein [Halococcus hamelinensis]|uniref:Uncharacterized protein n=1 Tax=Halococcus hamelinensis 100A6 TaxID=1132509 RepID=M0M4R6_9EURY|nr:hypothetical protein [Halococcus hamelinensis]EMA40807.1 hypothetical protein C447_03396 [Halococcus hamelinensis 100A6]